MGVTEFDPSASPHTFIPTILILQVSGNLVEDLLRINDLDEKMAKGFAIFVCVIAIISTIGFAVSLIS